MTLTEAEAQLKGNYRLFGSMMWRWVMPMD